jgi:hypothetical protein
MPRNVSGGSGHRAQRNSEGSKARNNRCLVDALLDDLRNGESTKGVYVGRVLKRMGSGRMQVFYTGPNGGVEQIMPMRGGLRGKGKKSVWVDIDSIVMICETGLAGTTHEIVAVFTESQIAGYKKFVQMRIQSCSSRQPQPHRTARRMICLKRLEKRMTMKWM